MGFQLDSDGLRVEGVGNAAHGSVFGGVVETEAQVRGEVVAAQY